MTFTDVLMIDGINKESDDTAKKGVTGSRDSDVSGVLRLARG